LCLWCDEKLIPRHKYKNKKLYSLCIVDHERDNEEDANHGRDWIMNKPLPTFKSIP
jgi:hypothetical protein